MRALALSLLLSLVACSPTLAQPPGQWQATAAPPGGLFYTQFVPLQGDRVFALGGSRNVARHFVTDTVQIYDAAANSWMTTVPIPEARDETAIAILHSGQLLVIGGTDARGSALKSVFLFDPIQLNWTRVADLHTARSAPTAVVLTDDRVLVVGGATGWTSQVPAPGEIADAEVFDPATNMWSIVPPLPTGGVIGPSAIVLGDGRVLVAGGTVQNSAIDRAALYEPARESWQTLPNLPQPRADATLELDPSGRVLIMGGHAHAGSPSGGGYTPNPALDAEFFDPRSLSWRLSSPPTSQRANNFIPEWTAVAALHDGRMLAIGQPQAGRPPLAFTYDPGADFWQVAGQPPLLQFGTMLVTLSDGRVLAISNELASIYDPTRSPAAPETRVGWLDSASTTLVLIVIGGVLALLVLVRRVV